MICVTPPVRFDVLMKEVDALDPYEQRVRLLAAQRAVRDQITELDADLARRRRHRRLSPQVARAAYRRRADLRVTDMRIQVVLAEVNARKACIAKQERYEENRRFERRFMNVARQRLGPRLYGDLINVTKAEPDEEATPSDSTLRADAHQETTSAGRT